MLTPSHTHPLTRTLSHTLSHTPSHTHPLSHTLSHTPSLTHTLTHTLSHTPSLTHPLTYTLSHTHAHVHAHSRSSNGTTNETTKPPAPPPPPHLKLSRQVLPVLAALLHQLVQLGIQALNLLGGGMRAPGHGHQHRGFRVVSTGVHPGVVSTGVDTCVAVIVCRQ